MKHCWAAGLLLLLTVASPAPGSSEQKTWTKDQIIRMLKGDVPPQRIGELARERGIDFPVTPETENELRQAGATAELVALLQQLAPKPAAPPKPAQIVVETQPDAQVYLDDVYKGQASPQGRLVIENPRAGQHVLRVSMPGKRDYEQPLTVVAGQEGLIRAVLETRAASIRVRTSPQAAVRLDEVIRGFADHDGQLVISEVDPGTHILKVSAEGEKDFRRALEVVAGQENTVDATLSAEEEPSPSAGPTQVFTLRHYGDTTVGWWVNPFTTNLPTHEGRMSISPGRLEWIEAGGKNKTKHDFVAPCESVTKLTTGNDVLTLVVDGKAYGFATGRGQASAVFQAFRNACPRLGRAI